MLGPGDASLEQALEDHLQTLKNKDQKKDDYDKYVLRVDKTADTSGFYLKSRP